MCGFGISKHGGFAYLLSKMHLSDGGLGGGASARRVLDSCSTNPVQFTTHRLVPLSGDLATLDLKEAIMSNLTILSKNVRLLNNLYSLNDLHRASGGLQNHKPIDFLKNKQTQELINEIDQSKNSYFAVNTKRGGRNAGTWVCKELVYSYAMWISPNFHLDDLIYELAKAKNVTTQNIYIHYNLVFNTNAWSQEQEFEHALAKRILKQDLVSELRTQSPELQLLKQQAKQHGLSLVVEQEYQTFQGRMLIQHQ